MTPEILATLLAVPGGGHAVVLATRLSDGAQMVLPGGVAPDGVAAEAAAALARGQSGMVAVDGAEWFLHVHAPPLRVVVVGAVHIAQALVRLAAVLELAVVVVDPRATFNSEARFGGVSRLVDWPDVAVGGLVADAQTAVVALAHDPKLDDPVLDWALRGDAFYVGALGSKKSQAARRVRLAALGHDEAALARVRGPVGLALGAVSAEEIALSIVAEIVAVRRGAALGVRG